MCWIRAIVALIVVSTPAAFCAPAPKDRPNSTAYFPIRVGDKWVMQLQNGDTTSEITEVVTEVEKKDGDFIVTVGRETNGEVRVYSKTRVSENGLFRMLLGKAEYDPPVCVLKLPARKGESWTSEPNGTGGKLLRTQKHTIIGEEEIDVPAGKFKAIRIDIELAIDSGKGFQSTIWYAPGVGPVKTISTIKDRERVQVLKSFTPGK